jgi:catechol 2,3-dioxygenase-like lactoylglutathione lyase family enzyme
MHVESFVHALMAHLGGKKLSRSALAKFLHLSPKNEQDLSCLLRFQGLSRWAPAGGTVRDQKHGCCAEPRSPYPVWRAAFIRTGFHAVSVLALNMSEEAMLSHVYIGITDFERAFAFYSAIMSEINCLLKFHEPEAVWAGWKPLNADRPLFLIGAPYDRQPATSGNGHMVAVLAPSREAVDRCHATAIAAGAKCEGPPGLRPHYHPNYYGAYFRDPDGNKIGVCYHEPVSAREPEQIPP